MILSLVFSGFLFLIIMRLVLLFLKRCLNSIVKLLFICLKVVNRCLCFLEFRFVMLECNVWIVFLRFCFLLIRVLCFF